MNEKRNELIWMYRQTGMPYQRIGDRFDLTKSMVSLICQKHQRQAEFPGSRADIEAKKAADELKGPDIAWLRFLADW